MSIRLLPVALLLATMPMLPAMAQSVHETHADASGAMAGRSPHKAFRPIAAQACRDTAMHSLPAGKGALYGTHALRGTCDPVRVAGASPAAPSSVHAPD